MRAKILIISICFLSFVAASAQHSDRESDKVEIFTYEEKSNLQDWFHRETERMDLGEEQQAQYSSVITYYIAKIARLDDKDMGLEGEALRKEINKLLEKQDKDLKEILSAEQFGIHKEIYGEFLRSAYKRWGIQE